MEVSQRRHRVVEAPQSTSVLPEPRIELAQAFLRESPVPGGCIALRQSRSSSGCCPTAASATQPLPSRLVQAHGRCGTDVERLFATRLRNAQRLAAL